VTWTQAGSFSDSLAVTFIGPFAGNNNSTPANAPAITATFDWFHNLATSGPSVAATPTFAPASGTSFSSTLSVSIADTTPGASIYYTTNGSTPTTSSTLYLGPFTISASTTINAIATASGFSQSAQGSAGYTYSPVTSGVGVSDEFNETSLNTSLWAVRAPAGGSAALSNGELVITVPGGSNHQALSTGLNLVRVMQPVSNGNFDVALKIDSRLTASAQQTFQGLLIGGDATDYIYYQVYSDGTNVDLQCTSDIAGTLSVRINTVPFTGYPVPTYLRLTRVGTTYTAYYSSDGVTWTQAGSFSDSLAVTFIGPFAGNNNSTPANAPAITATFDWFHNLTP
jgi:hypothetical protein